MGINSLPKILFFDAAGTLIHLPKGVAWHYAEVAGRWGMNLERDQLGVAFLKAWKEFPPPVETRVRRLDDDKEWWRELVGRTLLHCGSANGDWSKGFFDDLYGHFAGPGVWELYEDVLPVLTELRRSYRLALISNWDGRLRRVLDHLGIADWFDPVVISSEHGADKPSAYLFQRALDLAGIEACDALHIGDDPECDWSGAEAAGLRTFRLDRPRNSLEDLLNICGVV